MHITHVERYGRFLANTLESGKPSHQLPGKRADKIFSGIGRIH